MSSQIAIHIVPTEEPTIIPTEEPTVVPTEETTEPSEKPTVEPTVSPVTPTDKVVTPISPMKKHNTNTVTDIPNSPVDVNPYGVVVTGLTTNLTFDNRGTSVQAVDKEVTAQKTDSNLSFAIEGVITNPVGDSTIVIVKEPKYGIVVVNYDGTFSYRPNGETREDSFTYELINNGTVATATVTIKVIPEAAPTVPSKVDNITKTGEEISMLQYL